MVDLGFSGPFFTWDGVNKNGVRVYERLDRTICDIGWREMFPEAHIKHLAKTIYDHTLVLITLESKHIPNPEFKPFRFEAIWIKHESFKHYLESNWKSQDVYINQKLGFLSGKLRWWNKNMFGRLEWKRRRLLARIKGV
ncbi:hypothetical protein C1H46_026804 [Malus baccata]|uniref:Uncharacterized protein n=1 Tax=Malus baccata TaxID=106549 RepID=A0A540LM88_MALBA|nr:hypothetical protein C1H46_026804 [Malus baccata]